MSHTSLLPDKNNFLRRSIMGKYLGNIIDTLDFYDYVSRLHWVPVLGNPLLRMIMNHYGYRFHSGEVAILSDVLKTLDSAEKIAVSECACRVRSAKCDNPTRTCLKVNTGVDVEEAVGQLYSERITVEEAKAIVADSHKRGLLLCVEWCVDPYVYTVCSCCECCCLPRILRFERHIDGALFASEYIPREKSGNCKRCGECEAICPGDAISFQRNKFTVDLKKCVGCGLCESRCQNGAIELVKGRPPQHIMKTGPGMTAFVYISSYLILFPLALIFILFKGRRKRGREFDWHEHEHHHDHDNAHTHEKEQVSVSTEMNIVENKSGND